MPAGSFAKASSVGANTVNGPGPFRVSTRSAACSALASAWNDPAATAVSTMSLSPALFFGTAIATVQIANIAAMTPILIRFISTSPFLLTSIRSVCVDYRSKDVAHYEKTRHAPNSCDRHSSNAWFL